jgi:pyrroline-5-carboxylate reductase
MAEAMIAGLIRNQTMTAQQIIAAEPRLDRCEELAAKYGVRYTTDNPEALEQAHFVIISIKPQFIDDILPEIKAHAQHCELILSIAAGISIDHLCQGSGKHRVVRSMPNTPAKIGKGITVWMATPDVDTHQRQQAEMILRALGEVVYVDKEDYLDMATALSGTGPAYIFMVLEAMVDAGVHLGFSRRVSEQLVLQTMLGSIEYAIASKQHPASLRNEVTSPGGTSAEAIYHLEKGGLRTVLSRAIWAAYERSVELGKGKKVSPHIPEINSKERLDE